jgi:hypothetical protein
VERSPPPPRIVAEESEEPEEPEVKTDLGTRSGEVEGEGKVFSPWKGKTVLEDGELLDPRTPEGQARIGPPKRLGEHYNTGDNDNDASAPPEGGDDVEGK